MAQAAALALYTMLSLAPMLVIAVGVAGMVFGEEAAVNAIVTEFRGSLGESTAEFIQGIVQRASLEPSRGVVATVVGIVTLVVAAIGVFGQLKSALNIIWGVKLKSGRGIKGFIRDHFLSLAMLMCIAFLLLVSLAISTIITAAGSTLGTMLPSTEALSQVLNLVGGTVVISVLFAAMYKVLPDVKIAWRDVVLGAVVTAILFNVGKFLIGLYLGRASIVGVYGAAGSLVMVLLWVYYSAVIFLLGAEFTQVYARRRGAEIVPSERAEWLEPREGGKAPVPDEARVGASRAAPRPRA